MTTILIIDDHPIVAQGCRQLIEDAGLGTSVEANSAAEAIRAVHRFNPDVVIVDGAPSQALPSSRVMIVADERPFFRGVASDDALREQAWLARPFNAE